MATYPGMPQAETVSYPMLSPNEQKPMQYQDVAPVVDETQPLMLLEESSDEEPVSRTRRLGRSLKNRLVKLVGAEPPAAAAPPVNPEPASPLTGLAKLLAEKADTAALKTGGFSVDRMYEEGLGIDTLYNAGYNLREVKQLLPRWDQLKQVGFTKGYLGESWHVDQLVTLYGTEKFRKAEICRDLEFTIDDFQMARTTPEQYAELGITAETLVAMEITFEQLFAMHTPLDQFAEEFGVKKEHIQQFKLTPHQARALAATRGWHLVALADMGLDDDEVAAFGVGLE